MLFRTICTLLLMLSLFQVVTAQEPEGPSLVFGEVSIAELEKPESLIEKSASAEILGDYGNINERGKYTRFIRTKIYNSKGYNYADITITKYNNAKISSIKGFTHNLIDGIIEKTPLDDGQIVEEKVFDDIKQIKITFPKVKPGSVLDLEIIRKFKQGYTIKEWVFQQDIPVVWSDLTIINLESRSMQYHSQGSEPFAVFEETDLSKKKGNDSIKKVQYRWARANLLPIKNEPFVSSINNYIARLDFQLKGGATYKRFIALLLLSDYFKGSVNTSSFLDPILPKFKPTVSALERAKQIFYFIRDNMKWNGYYGKLPKPLKDAWEKKEGDVPTINYLLTAALVYSGLQTNPIVLSSRENGIPHPLIAFNHKMNYLISSVYIDGEWILLDASDKSNPFGVLPLRCLNDRGWRLTLPVPDSVTVDLAPKNSIETSVRADLIVDKSGAIGGKISRTYTSYSSYEKRDILTSLGEEKVLESENRMDIEWKLKNLIVINKNDNAAPLVIDYEVTNSEHRDKDLIYLKAVISSPFKKSPFEAEERTMDINFPYRTLNRYVSSIAIPDNYVVDEIPTSKVLETPDKDLFFQFTAYVKDNTINIISTFRINGLNYPVEEYPEVKSFFETVVNKQNEQIVLRRVK